MSILWSRQAGLKTVQASLCPLSALRLVTGSATSTQSSDTARDVATAGGGCKHSVSTAELREDVRLGAARPEIEMGWSHLFPVKDPRSRADRKLWVIVCQP